MRLNDPGTQPRKRCRQWVERRRSGSGIHGRRRWYPRSRAVCRLGGTREFVSKEPSRLSARHAKTIKGNMHVNRAPSRRSRPGASLLSFRNAGKKIGYSYRCSSTSVSSLHSLRACAVAPISYSATVATCLQYTRALAVITPAAEDLPPPDANTVLDRTGLTAAQHQHANLHPCAECLYLPELS